MEKDVIKQKVRERYGRMALSGSSNCCSPECCSGSQVEAATIVGYEAKELGMVPQSSIIGAGCGAPVRFAELQKGETVVDLGSGAGIDVFLSANSVGRSGKVIGIDMTDEMLNKARKNAGDNGYANVEFRKGDIEVRIPVDDNSVDAVISNCVINLTTDKVQTFREIHRILKSGGRMIISDLVADRKSTGSIDIESWTSCIDGALAKSDYMRSIRDAGFEEVQVLEERLFNEGNLMNGRKIASLVIKAVKL
jgi:ubiquinone/menaquinone biosynthesis C-methylase UbiE